MGKYELVNSEFAKWATGFAGCDGGNLGGGVWLCGIEFGGRETEATFEFQDFSVPGSITDEPGYERREFLTSQYNKKAIKLLAALAGENVCDYRLFFREHECFDRHSIYFKLNLYPLSFHSVAEPLPSWLVERVGLSTKKQYVEWCVENRFPIFRKWVQDNSPSLVLCTGITHIRGFQSAFGTGDETVQTEEVAGGKNIKYFITNSGRTMVAIIYFLGNRYGLNSNIQLWETGRSLAELLRTNIEGSSERLRWPPASR